MKLGIDISNQNKIDISTDAIRRHLYIIGKSGVGKSVLLEHTIFSLLDMGWGVCVIDPHGDLAEKIADTIPENRFNDIIYFDPSNLSHVIGYNPLKDTDTDNRPLIADNVLSAFAHVWGLGPHTPRLLHILRNSLRLLLDNRQTLLGLQRLLADRTYMTRLLRNVSDPTVATFWRDEFGAWNEKQRAEYLAPLQNKIGALVSNPAMRNVLGQEDGLDLSRVMNEGKVLICNLSKGRLGEETSNLLGALITSGFAQAAQERANVPEESRRDFTLVIDEFQNFTTTAFASILSEARKYRLSLVVAHQFMSQIPDFLQDAVIGTANTTIAFRCGAKDAHLLGEELDLDNHRRVKNLPNHHALVRTVEGGMPGNTHEIETDPPQKAGKRLEAVRRHTRECYGQPRETVERNIERLLG